MGLYSYLKAFIGTVVFCLAATLRANNDYEPRVYESEDGKKLPYRIYLPKGFEKSKKYPLVIFFHGAGERGKDNLRHLKHGAGQIVKYCKDTGTEAIVIAPQCPHGKQWVDTPWGDDSHTMPEKPSEPMRLTMELLKKIRSEYIIDKKRIYVTGLSMGGYGAWDIVQRNPDIFAACIPICGGGDTAMAKKIKKVPFWVFHGGKDTVVKPKRSRDMVAALKEAGGDPKYTEYTYKHHNSWGKTYANPKVFEWLFEQKR